MRYSYFLLVFCLLFLASCKNEKKENSEKSPHTKTEKPVKTIKPNPAKKLAKSIESTHHKENFTDKKAVSFHLNLSFDGQPRMGATVSLMTNYSKIKVEKGDGTTLIYDGKNAMLFPKNKMYKQAEFDMWTWAYFFSLPFKLTDPGTKWQDKGQDSINGKLYNTAKLTFEKGTGDSSDDWYVVYADKNTNMLAAAAYIVTYGGKNSKKAAENPHAIVYKNYFTLKKVPMAKNWEFHHWSKDKGVYGKPIGKATISKVKFFNPSQGFFTAPKDAVHLEK